MTEKEGFIDSQVLTKWVKYFLWVQIVVALMAVATDVWEYHVLSNISNDFYDTYDQMMKEINDSDLRQSIMGILYIAVFVISGILILKWIHRMNHNARQLGGEHMQFTPGWSIGYYFIPFVNLWKPYQAMVEIFNVSKNPNNWSNETESFMLGVWWFLWIVNNILGRLIFRWSQDAEEITAFINLNILTQVSDVLDILLSLSLLWIVKKVYVMQVKQVDKKLRSDESGALLT